MSVSTSIEPDSRESMNTDSQSTTKSAFVDGKKSTTVVSKKKKVNKRRRKNENSVNNNKFSVYLVNIRGASSKLISLKSIIDNPQVEPNLVTLVETNLRKNSKLE